VPVDAHLKEVVLAGLESIEQFLLQNARTKFHESNRKVRAKLIESLQMSF